MITFLATIPFIALATWQAVEVWHHSSLFLNWRAGIEADGGFRARVTECPFCLSHWVAGALMLLITLTFFPWVFLLAWPVAFLAVTRLANLGNDLTHPFTRTPKFNFDEMQSWNPPDE